jgi:SnoaL-like domain
VTSKPESLLATLEAERSMHETFVRFFHLVDTRQWHRVASECFTPEGVLVYDALPAGTSQSLEGRAGIDAFYGQNAGYFAGTAHVAGQWLVDWSGDRPRLTASVTAWHWFAAPPGAADARPADWTVVAVIDDDYDLVDGTWLISHRRVTPQGGPVAVGRLPGAPLAG